MCRIFVNLLRCAGSDYAQTEQKEIKVAIKGVASASGSAAATQSAHKKSASWDALDSEGYQDQRQWLCTR